MKFNNYIKDEDQLNALRGAAKRKRKTRQSMAKAMKAIKQIVDANPGIDMYGVGKALGYSHPVNAYKFLGAAVKAGKIKERRLDGKKRYYPASYLTPARAIGGLPSSAPTPPQTSTKPLHTTLKELAMEYCWEKDRGMGYMKEFIDWVKAKNV